VGWLADHGFDLRIGTGFDGGNHGGAVWFTA
jgi:hypothetical protein